DMIFFKYTLNDIELDRVTEIRDLGVMLSSNMSFNMNVDQTCSKAFKMAGFIKRSCKSFSGTYKICL
ncbi:hypothetical protein NL495_28870, partial [Klebsiella pneumoniae]|nr:hypothetical protein [Klebsiella pneumoniae]